mgnify:CR=1 FL=1
MEELIYRNNLNQDWISFIFFINLIILSLIFKINPPRFRSIILFHSIDIYIKRFSNEKKFNMISAYNILCFIIIISTLSLFLILLLQHNYKTLLFAFEYYYLFSLLILMFSIRYIFIQILINQLEINYNYRIGILKNFINNFRFALFYLIFLLIVNYVEMQNRQFLLFTLCYLIIWIFYQFRILILLFKKHYRIPSYYRSAIYEGKMKKVFV